MTYAEALENNPDLITAPIDDALKATIADWFNLRHICDDNNFGTFFNRVLNRDYERYYQILRVQPGIASYDWLVANYMERETTGQTQNTQTGTNTTKVNGSTSSTGKQTNGGTDTTTNTNTGTNSSTVTHNTQDKTTDTAQNTVEESGTDSTEKSGSSNRTVNLTDETAYTGNETDTKSGNETHNRAYKPGEHVTETETVNRQKQTTTESGGPETLTNNYSANKAAAKAGAMDAGITATGTETLPTTSHFDMGTIPDITPDFNSHASSIQQSAGTDKTLVQEHLDTVTTVEYSGVDATGAREPDTAKTTTNAYTDTDNTTVTYNNVTDTKTYSNRKDTATHTGTDNTTTSEDGSTTYGKKTEGTNSGTTTVDRTGTDSTTGNTTDNGTSSTTYGHTLDTSNTGTSEQTTTGNTSQTTNGETLNHEQFTGRTESPADLLTRAVAFIETTNAWEWLMPRLDTCFISIYDI